MTSIILISFLIGFLWFNILRTRRLAARQDLQHRPTDLRWRVRYADGKMSQMFNLEMAKNHQKVFGGKVMLVGNHPGEFCK